MGTRISKKTKAALQALALAEVERALAVACEVGVDQNKLAGALHGALHREHHAPKRRRRNPVVTTDGTPEHEED